MGVKCFKDYRYFIFFWIESGVLVDFVVLIFLVISMLINKKIIVWFRRDLRIEDNFVLVVVVYEGFVFFVFIWCFEEEG